MDRRMAIPGGWGLLLTLALTGVTATVAQIVLLRELIVVFNGNEISLGLMLACWLLWTAAGSAVWGGASAPPPGLGPARRLKAGGGLKGRPTGATLAALLALEGCLLPATIYAARESKALLESAPGELLGPGAMLAASALVLSAFCLSSGSVFACASRLYGEIRSVAAGEASREVYLLEAAGAAAGGLLASALLIRWFGAFDIALGLAVANLIAALRLVAPRQRRALTAAIAAALALVAFVFLGPALERSSRARLWKGFRVLTSVNSLYGNLTVVEGEGARSIYDNGLVLATAPDQAAAEEAVHYALLEHPGPKRLLLIGGGINGGILEAFRHPTLEHVDYVELDPELLEMARRYFAPVWTKVERDGRVSIHIADGRALLKRPGPAFDVIIVNLPDPQTAQLNRFYTVEFYREAAARLAPGGVLAFGLRGAENYISSERAAFYRAIDKTLSEVFPERAALPGETTHFFASRRKGVLVRSAEELIARLRARGLQTQYVREYYLPFRMTPDRMAELERQIRPLPGTPVNRDFAPVAYYFSSTLWSTRFSGWLRWWLELGAGIGFAPLAAGGVAILSALALALARRRGGEAALAAACGGFTLMNLEILLLLGFQALHGYVYHELAVLTAALMAGLAAGAYRAAGSGGPRALGRLQLGIAAAPVLLMGALGPLGALGSLGAGLLFPALALGCGWLGGRQFAAATGVFFAEAKAGPGALYAADLAGACLGALLLSAYLVPVFGFWKTALLAGLLNLPPAGVLLGCGLKAARQ